MQKNGFARTSIFMPVVHESNRVVFELRSSEETRECYPFDFCLQVEYEWGCMNYTRFIVDPKDVPQDPEAARRLHNEIWNAGVRAAMENGGVINDHHGIGLKLSRLMKEQYGPAMQVMEALKKQLDPNGIMNPYKLGL